MEVAPAPEMISISEEISSPVTASRRTSSSPAASRSSSKRGTMSCVSGSRIANSSSIPIVRSVDSAKVWAARSRSMLLIGAGCGVCPREGGASPLIGS